MSRPEPLPKHVEILRELSAEEFARWKHHPITAAFWAYLEDLTDRWEDLALELLVSGAYRLNDPHEDRNPDVVRGKLLTLKVLAGISLADIQGFYAEEPADSQEVRQDAKLPRRRGSGY